MGRNLETYIQYKNCNRSNQYLPNNNSHVILSRNDFDKRKQSRIIWFDFLSQLQLRVRLVKSFNKTFTSRSEVYISLNNLTPQFNFLPFTEKNLFHPSSNFYPIKPQPRTLQVFASPIDSNVGSRRKYKWENIWQDSSFVSFLKDVLTF